MAQKIVGFSRARERGPGAQTIRSDWYERSPLELGDDRLALLAHELLDVVVTAA